MKKKSERKEQMGRTATIGIFRRYSVMMGILLLWLGSFGNAAAQTVTLVDPDNGTNVELPKVPATPAGDSYTDGDRIFNTTTQSVLRWTGNNWHTAWYVKAPDPASVDYVELPTLTECGCIQPVRFMKYNLGADKTLDDPKKQIEHISLTNAGKTSDERQTDARVLGGLYQWGRKDITHGASGDTYVRYYIGPTDNPTTAQTDNPAATDPFYIGNKNWYKNTALDADALWGNGYDRDK